jgi:hypothetical protein
MFLLGPLVLKDLGAAALDGYMRRHGAYTAPQWLSSPNHCSKTALRINE